MDKLPTLMQAIEEKLGKFTLCLGIFLPWRVWVFCMKKPKKSVLIARQSQYAEWDLKKISNTLTETLPALFLMA